MVSVLVKPALVLLPASKRAWIAEAMCVPVSEMLADRVFSLPMHPYLEDAEIDRIVEVMAA